VKQIIDDQVVLSRPLEGPLATQIAAFARWARAEGYARQSRHRQVLLAACFSRWLGQKAITARRISSEHPARYLRSRARRVHVRRGDAAALRQFLDLLRRQGVIPAEKVSPRQLTPVEQGTQAFARYLREERSLSDATVVNYVPFIRGFLTDRFGEGPVRLSRLCAGDVVRFVQRQASRLHLKRAKLLTSALRSFLHYVRYRGDIALDLAAAVPPRRQLDDDIDPPSDSGESRTPAACLDQSAYGDRASRLRDPARARTPRFACERGGLPRAR
jgi:integrase/recombinase XerD